MYNNNYYYMIDEKSEGLEMLDIMKIIKEDDKINYG
jgi:hypothetical protein